MISFFLSFKAFLHSRTLESDTAPFVILSNHFLSTLLVMSRKCSSALDASASYFSCSLFRESPARSASVSSSSSVAVGFFGSVASTLLHACASIAPKVARASPTVRGVFCVGAETLFSGECIGKNHTLFYSNVNSPERCYHCFLHVYGNCGRNGGNTFVGSNILGS